MIRRMNAPVAHPPATQTQPQNNRRGRTIRCVVAALVPLGALAVALVAFDSRLSSTAPPAAVVEKPGDEPSIDAVRRRIAAESRGEVFAAPVRAPQPPTHGGGANDPVGASPVPTPPDGYSFTSAPTRLEQAHLPHLPQPADSSAQIEPQRDHDDLDWLFDEAPRTAAAIVGEARRTQRGWVFGWLRLADGANAADAARAVSRFGIDVVGASGRLLRAKLPADEARLAAAVELAAVSGIGVVPPQRKAHADFQAELHAAPWQAVPVLITLMANDQDGRWRRELLARGAEVGRFDADLRAYAANVDAAAFDAIVQADFVLAVEPIGVFRATHDTAVPAMGADAVRSHTDAPGLFSGTGGGAVPIGVLDTGLNTNHLDIASHRQSICGANFIRGEYQLEDADLWVDEHGHGTHVTGTIAGNGFAEATFAGMAPSVAHIRFAKVLSRDGSGYLTEIHRGMDFLSRASACGTPAVAVKPLVVNMSLGANSRLWHGRNASERKLDAVVWAHRQLYVVAQSNASISGFSNFGAAKSSLSVGAIQDNGELAGFSSWGPTFDGRLAPQVVGTGVEVFSARGNGNRGGYVSQSGTSMASPAVAGVAALLLDAVADYREHPALTRARLMASAIKPDTWLDAGDAWAVTNSDGPGVLQDQFGLGKASARTSVLQREQADGWESGAATSTLAHGAAGHQDIEVPEGASRLDVVLAWDEPPADTIGSTVLNDLDLWLDKDGDCEVAACGEHASTSRRDNVEWIIVKNPAPGTYRARVVARRVYTAAPRAGLAWTVVRGPSKPTLRLALDEVRSIGDWWYRVALSVSVDGYVGAGVRVAGSGCSMAADADCEQGVRELKMRPLLGEDGATHSPRAWGQVLVGEVAVGERQQVVFDVGVDEAARIYFTASAWNANSAAVSVALPDPMSGEAPPAEAAPPANDNFADATVLAGASGSIAADLLAATFEPGEPPTGGTERMRPAGSVWYRWTAPAAGAARFGVPAEVYVDLWRGHQIAALTPLASSRWGLSFFAEEGETYHVRVSRLSRQFREPAQLPLRWFQGPRPANDDFVDAAALSGAEGEVSGDNRGATLQAREQFGELAATVWHRWTAPEDGAWRFQTGDWQSYVLVFTGDSLAALRLASGLPSSVASLPAKAGVEYRIAVASRSALYNGRSFHLQWEQYERGADADDFAHASELTGESGSESATVGDSVEPDEPAQTGVRTRWWQWPAPASGRFTWRLADTVATEIKVAVFTSASAAEGDADDEDAAGGEGGAATSSLTGLQWVAGTGPRVTSTEFAFAAERDRRYWISVGYHTGDRAAFASSDTATLEWGEAPANDAVAQAITLAGGSGSTTASNNFATLAPDEPSGALGHSSLWWSFTPEDAGWYRFWVEDAETATLAIYRVSGAGFDGLERVARSHGDWRAPEEDEDVSALFDAAPGQRYLIRVGRRGDGADGEWTLHWAPADAPTWLRYVGRLRSSALGLAPPATRGRAFLAFEDRGKALYLGTSEGLRVLARDAGSGALEQVHVVDGAQLEALLWHRGRSKLYALAGCDWRQLAPNGDSRLTLVDEGALAINDRTWSGACGADAAFWDSTGAFLQHGHAEGIDVYAIGETGLTAVQRVAIAGFKHAVGSRAGSRVYATDGDSLQVFTRDEDTGSLTAAGEVELANRAVTIAASEDDAYLVALDWEGTADAYELAADSLDPQHLNTLHINTFDAAGNRSWRDVSGGCGFLAARSGAAAMDAFCRNSAFSVAFRIADESARLEATDYMANWQADRFNNYIPQFQSHALATSPDGRHAYVYSEGEILIFERIGAGAPAP